MRGSLCITLGRRTLVRRRGYRSVGGLDVLRRLRDGEGPADCRALLLTARARDAEVDAGFAAGADDYVIKPFSPRELLRRVDALLGR